MKFFWGQIRTVVTNSFNETLDRKELSFTQKQGMIPLLHSHNKIDKQLTTNNIKPIKYNSKNICGEIKWSVKTKCAALGAEILLQSRFLMT